MKVNTIILGSTGMVGEGVLHECLNSENVESVLVVNRRSCEVEYPKLKEIILEDFREFDSIGNELKNYNVFYFCMGISSVGVSAEHYENITYNLTLAIANSVVKHNTDMVFTYVSGAGTDSSEARKPRWARVKGKTENDLLKLPFKDAYMFRPGYTTHERIEANIQNLYVFHPAVPSFENPLSQVCLYT